VFTTPVAKESGANIHPWQTPVSIVNQELSDCDARTQLTELLYRALIKLTILSGIPSLVNNHYTITSNNIELVVESPTLCFS